MTKTLDEKAKVLFWDIECTHLKADFGTILCIGYKWLHEKKVHIISLTDYRGWRKDVTDDSKVVRDFAEVLTEADVWVTYYGKGFDVKYMQAKLLEHGLPYLPNTPHVDLFYTVKGNLALSRKSLDNVSRFLKLKNEKTPVKSREWKKAMVGNRKAIKYVVDHCIADVKILEEAYHKLKPLARTHPLLDGEEKCRSCGSPKLNKRGYHITAKRKRRRMCCSSCGAWMLFNL